MPVTILEDVVVNRAMVIVAHPDDAEFGNAGMIASWTDAGVEVCYVLVTNGAAGSSDPEMTRERLTSIREAEQKRACGILGVQQLVFLGFEDGQIEPTLEVREAVSREIRRFKPDVVIGPDPTVRFAFGVYVNHPDHIAVGEVVCRAINPDASSGLAFPHLWREEGLAPHLPQVLLLQSFREGDFLWDITETIERKLDALACHESQHDDAEGVGSFVREAGKGLGKKLGVDYAEAFKPFRVGSGDPADLAEDIAEAMNEPNEG
jgi:LmbE family N-acetylglucosaminyl deacetylase